MLYIYIYIFRQSSEPLFWQFDHQFQQYDGRRHRFSGNRRSHYYNIWPTGDGNTMVEDTNLLVVTKATILVVWASAAFVEATILTIYPLVSHYSAIRWAARPIQWCLLEPLFGGSTIGPPPQAAPLAKPPVLVVYLKCTFKLKKYDHWGK